MHCCELSHASSLYTKVSFGPLNNISTEKLSLIHDPSCTSQFKQKRRDTGGSAVKFLLLARILTCLFPSHLLASFGKVQVRKIYIQLQNKPSSSIPYFRDLHLLLQAKVMLLPEILYVENANQDTRVPTNPPIKENLAPFV